ncbi:MAG TPA: MSMEG_0565 family glycosyltransferase [Actinomycetota bacterium]|nr:MSMEG_0565 family glycosyltransferase [Actinomycetota bacterium]
MTQPRVAMVTFSTRPRGGAVHTLFLAEALERRGQPVHVFALGDPDIGFFRPTTVPFTICRSPESDGTLEDKVMRSVDTLAEHLRGVVPGNFDLVHAQDCIAARAAVELRNEHPALRVVRTVHHIDDFSTQALIDCQNHSVVDPDYLIVVSRFWQRVVENDYRRSSTVITNGVDARRFRRPEAFDPAGFRSRVEAGNRVLLLTVGGIEPRKGSLELFEALAQLKKSLGNPPVLVVVGGHSFRDHSAYRDAALARAEQLGLEEGSDYHLLGTVSDEDLVGWYHAADAFVFPSVKEGWGLVVLEALSAGLPVLATDIDVFREYLDEQTAVLVPPGDATALAGGLARLCTDERLRNRLSAGGPAIASRYTWEECAARHIDVYRALAG